MYKKLADLPEEISLDFVKTIPQRILADLCESFGLPAEDDNGIKGKNVLLELLQKAPYNMGLELPLHNIVKERDQFIHNRNGFIDILDILEKIIHKIPIKERELKEILGDTFEEASENSTQLEIYSLTVQQLKREMEADEHRILVFGDAKSGKSLLINTLLKKCRIVLPSRPIHCSARICEIEFGADECLEVNNRRIPKSMFIGPKKWEEKVNAVLAPEAHEERHSRKRDLIKYKVDSDFLKTGIVLVDSPGLNESEELSLQVSMYTPRAMCMLVLLSAKAGGISDTLKTLLYHLNEQHSFDPRRLFFVVTHIDSMGTNDWPQVKKKIRYDITRIYPQLLKPSLHKINMRSAFQAQCLGIATVELQTLCLNLIAHISNSHKFQMTRVYNRVMVFMELAFKPINMFLGLVSLTEAEKEEQINQRMKELKELQGKVTDSYAKIEKEINKLRDDVINKITKVLSLKEKEIEDNSLFCINFESIKSLTTATQSISLAVFEEVKDQINHSDEATNAMVDFKYSVENKYKLFMGEIGNLDKRLGEIEMKLSLRNGLKVPTPRITWFDSNKEAIGSVAGMVTALLLAPLTLAGMVAVGIGIGIMKLHELHEQSINDSDRELLLTNPKSYMTSQMRFTIEQWISTKSKKLREYVSFNSGLQTKDEIMKKALKKIGNSTEYNMTLLQHLKNLKDFSAKNSQYYKNLHKELSECNDSLYILGFLVAPSNIRCTFLDVSQKKYRGQSVDIIEITDPDLSCIQEIDQATERYRLVQCDPDLRVKYFGYITEKIGVKNVIKLVIEACNEINTSQIQQLIETMPTFAHMLHLLHNAKMVLGNISKNSFKCTTDGKVKMEVFVRNQSITLPEPKEETTLFLSVIAKLLSNEKEYLDVLRMCENELKLQ